VSIDPDLIAAMNRWRLAQWPIQSPVQAILSLIQLGLKADGVLIHSEAESREEYELEALVTALRKATRGDR